MKLFISYRREDSIDITGRIFDRLSSRVGRDHVFMDVDSIPLGVDFRTHLTQWIARTDVFLAIVGPEWLDARYRTGPRKGLRRIDCDDDFVRVELSAALATGMPVIPVMVGGASMPALTDLPKDLENFCFMNAAEVRSGREFNDDLERLVRGIEQSLRSARGADAAQAAPLLLLQASSGIALVRPANLGFEGMQIDGVPFGWLALRQLEERPANLGAATVIERQDRDGRCLLLEGAANVQSGIMTMAQVLSLSRPPPTRIRVSARCCRRDGDPDPKRAWIFAAHVDGNNRGALVRSTPSAVLNGHWEQFSTILDVPATALHIVFGCSVVPGARAMFDDFSIEFERADSIWQRVR